MSGRVVLGGGEAGLWEENQTKRWTDRTVEKEGEPQLLYVTITAERGGFEAAACPSAPHTLPPLLPPTPTHLLQQVLLQGLDLLLRVQPVPKHARVHTVVVFGLGEACGD